MMLFAAVHESAVGTTRKTFGGAAIPAAIGGLAEAVSVLTPLPNLTDTVEKVDLMTDDVVSG